MSTSVDFETFECDCDNSIGFATHYIHCDVVDCGRCGRSFHINSNGTTELIGGDEE